jgi:thiosulfate/3-mercaptopyruvate sulfurtransferase
LAGVASFNRQSKACATLGDELFFKVRLRLTVKPLENTTCNRALTKTCERLPKIMHPLLSLSQLDSLNQNQTLLMVDARGGPDAFDRYLAGHLPGAIFVDLETELSLKRDDARFGGRHPLPNPNDFCKVVADLGISPDSFVVVYDDKQGTNAAARFWWMLRSIGHQRVAVLDGDYHTAIAAGWKPESGLVLRRPIDDCYFAKNWGLPLATIDDVESGLATGDVVVIDVREKYRYLGESEPIDRVAGHIPGAVNVPYVQTISSEGKLLEPSALTSLWAPYLCGRDPQQVILHCGSGVTACHALLAMEIAGLPGARLYVGSWSEWSRRDKPIATGS